MTPEESGYAGTRTLAVVESERQVTKKNTSGTDTRYYNSSLGQDEITAEKMGERIRGHWASVENGTHWRRDVLLGEDGTRSRNAMLLGNLALMRNVLLALHEQHYPGRNLMELIEAVQRRPALALHLIRSPWP